MIVLSYGEFSKIPVWSLYLMMSQNNKHQLIHVVANLVEASNFQHLPKSNISTYVPVHFSLSNLIFTPLSNLERVGLVGCARKSFAFLKIVWRKLARYLVWSWVIPCHTLSRCHRIWTLLSNMKKMGLVGFAIKSFEFFKYRLKEASQIH